MTLRDIAIALGFKVDESKAKEAENRITDIKNFAVKALGAIGIGFSLVEMNALAEEFNGINDQIKNATDGLGEQKDIQDQIMKSANDTKMSYADTAKMVGALVQENKELFGNIGDAIAFNDAVTKTFKVAGKSNEEIAGLMEAINKSFAKGKVDTETINKLLEQSPEAVAYLNRQLGSTADQLEQMVSEGRISLADLRDAFVNNADEINANFAGLDYSISDALLNIRNRWGYWLNDMNSSIDLTQSIAKFMTRAFDTIMSWLNKAKDVAEKVVKRFGGIENVMKLLAISGAIMIAAFKGKQILSFLKTVTGLLNIANLKILAIVAVVLAVALAVEDFINFMQGNNSVIGETLQKMGYDVDEVRDRIITAWNKVKGFLMQVWLSLSGAAQVVVGKLKEFWVNNGEEITGRLKGIWEGLKTILSVLWNLLFSLAQTIFGALSAFWDKWGDNVRAALAAIFDAIGGIFKAFLKIVQGIIDFLAGVFTGDWEKAWEGIVEIFTGIWDAVVAFFKGIWDTIYALFGEKIDAILGKVKKFVDGVKNLLKGVGDFFGSIGDAVGDFLNSPVASSSVSNTTVARASGGGNRTNNVKQDVTINNTFNGTDQRTMSQSATRSAKDTTDQLAKGLKYGT